MTETNILDESAVSEIEARPARVSTHFEELIILTPAERDALCATVRHLRAALSKADQIVREGIDAKRDLQSQLEQLRAENVSLTKSLRDAYEFYMGPHACGDFTCECDQPKLCGICEIREATELALAKNLIETSPVVNCNPSRT